MKVIIAIALALLQVSAVRAEDSLAAARELYASAAYEDALAMLGRINTSSLRQDDGRVADQYRALCLLALGKNTEASQAIELVVAAEPAYHPSESDVSPRVRAVFSDVRRRLLPGLLQQKYAQAKTAYDRKDYKVAAVAFGELLALFDDQDLAGAAQKPPLSDLRVLTDGFHQLSLQSLAPPPAPEPPPAVAAVRPPAPAPEPPRIYSSSDANVVAPSALRQDLPPYAGILDRPFVAAMEVVIDENGKVVSATIRGAVPASYDRQAVAAAQAWRYRPATLNGAPVKFRKFIQLSVTPR